MLDETAFFNILRFIPTSAFRIPNSKAGPLYLITVCFQQVAHSAHVRSTDESHGFGTGGRGQIPELLQLIRIGLTAEIDMHQYGTLTRLGTFKHT